jgi:Lsr2
MQVLMVVDDVDGRSPADEQVTLGLNGKSFALDLTTAHADELRAVIAPWIARATAIDAAQFEASGHKPVRPRQVRTHSQRMTARRLRAWAMEQREYRDQINPAGQFPQEVINAWNKAHPEDIYERHISSD